MANGITADSPPLKFDQGAFEKWFVRIIWLAALGTIVTFWTGTLKTKDKVDALESTVTKNTIRIDATEAGVKNLNVKTDQVLDMVNQNNVRLARIEGYLRKF